MFKQYQPVNGNIVFKKADEDAKMKELVFENGYVVDYEEALNVANPYPMTIKFAISAQTVKIGRGYICTGLAGKQLMVVS